MLWYCVAVDGASAERGTGWAVWGENGGGRTWKGFDFWEAKSSDTSPTTSGVGSEEELGATGGSNPGEHETIQTRFDMVGGTTLVRESARI